MTNQIPNLNLVGSAQCIPLWWYPKDGSEKRPALPEKSLQWIQAKYPDKTINHEDVFYYIYGLFHTNDYKNKYQDNLAKDLPRIPFPKSSSKFFEISEAGKKLGDLHVNYDDQALYPDCKLDYDKHIKS